jgi:hypothetical protein
LGDHNGMPKLVYYLHWKLSCISSNMLNDSPSQTPYQWLWWTRSMDMVDLVKEAPFWGKVSFPYFVNPLPTFKWILGEIWHKKWQVGPNSMSYAIALSWGFFSHKNCGSWHVWDKLCDFNQYNVQHLMFIVTYKLH